MIVVKVYYTLDVTESFDCESDGVTAVGHYFHTVNGVNGTTLIIHPSQVRKIEISRPPRNE